MNRPAGIVDVDNVVCIAQRRCADLGVTVRFDSRTPTAYTNGSAIVLPVLKQPITQEQLDTLYGYTIHETGHHIRDDAFKILRSAQPPDHVCALYNIIEDYGMERERGLEWRGDHKALSLMNSILMDKAYKEWDSALAESQPPEPLAAMFLNQLARLDWDDGSEVVLTRLIQGTPDTAKQLLDALVEEGWVEKMQATKTPHDTWDVTVDLAKRLYPSNDQDEYEEIRKAGHDMTLPRDTSNDTMEDSNNAKAGDGESERDELPVPEDGGRIEDDGENDADSVQPGQGRVVSWKDVVLSEHTEWEQSDGDPGSIGIDWTGHHGYGGVALMPTKLINVVDLAKSKADPTGNSRSWGSKHWEHYMPHNEHSRAFANRMRRYIQAEARSVIDKDKYHGKLDRSAIVKLALPPIDGGEYNKKIFYDQRKHTLKDTAIFVLTDWSGSMSGRKMELAADASQRLVHVFERILKVPVALAAFSDAKTPCDIGYIKPYNTRGLPPEEIAKRFAKFYVYCSANNDGDSVHWAWHEILKRKETRKILIVLSDGCPAGSWKNACDYETLKYVTKSIEQDGRVELYGVGICSNAVETYYTNSKVLNTPEEINETLFRIIKEGNNARRRSA